MAWVRSSASRFPFPAVRLTGRGPGTRDWVPSGLPGTVPPGPASHPGPPAAAGFPRRAPDPELPLPSRGSSFRLIPDGKLAELVPGHRLGPDSWQFFVKISYLFRF